MDLLNNKSKSDISKPEIEQVVRDQTEYTLLGNYLISRGFKLFSYNPSDGNIELVEIKVGEFIQCELVQEGSSCYWIWFDPENKQTTIDSRMYYFEALNLKLAINRVHK